MDLSAAEVVRASAHRSSLPVELPEAKENLKVAASNEPAWLLPSKCRRLRKRFPGEEFQVGVTEVFLEPVAVQPRAQPPILASIGAWAHFLRSWAIN